MAPAPRSPSVWRDPTLTDVQSAAVPICTGAVRAVVLPSPSSPHMLSPQAHRVPSVRTAAVLNSPALTTRYVCVPTRAGTARLVVPSPSWPEVPRPQVQSEPSVRSAVVWLPPAATLDQL